MTETRPTENRYCIDCRYSLRGLEEHRCPECGREFNPSDLETTAATAKRIKQWPAYFHTHLSASWVLAVGAALLTYAIDEEDLFWSYTHHNAEIVFITFGIAAFAFGITRRREVFSVTAAVGFLVMIIGFVFPILIDISPFRIWEYIIMPFATLFCMASLTAGSVIHLMRDVNNRRRWLKAYFLPVAAWAYVAWVLAQYALALDSEILDYWTYWVWTPVRW